VIGVERLIACALGDLAGDAADEVEEHVLSCSACAATYAKFVRLGPAIRALVRDGGTTVPATPALVDAAEAAGLVTRRYVLTPGAVVPCTVDASDIYSLTSYVGLDLAGVSRLDFVRAGTRIADVPFDARAGRLYMLTRAETLRALPTMKLPIRLVAVEDGGERTIAEVTLDHTAFEAPEPSGETGLLPKS
jgi:hypothetical protein